MRMGPSDLRALDREDWRVLRAALLLTPLAALGLRTMSLPAAVRIAARLPFPSSARSIHRRAQLVHGALRRVGASCLTRSLVLHTMLAKSGAASTLVVGASRSGGRFRAHAWVEVDGRIVSVDGADGYEPLYRLGPPRIQRVTA